MTLGETIREMRESRGIRQRELARRLGVQPSLVSSIETGARTHIGEQMLQRISMALELSASEAQQLKALRRGVREGGVVEIPPTATEAEIHTIRLLASCVGKMPSLQFLALGQYLEQWRTMNSKGDVA